MATESFQQELTQKVRNFGPQRFNAVVQAVATMESNDRVLQPTPDADAFLVGYVRELIRDAEFRAVFIRIAAMKLSDPKGATIPDWSRNLTAGLNRLTQATRGKDVLRNAFERARALDRLMES